MYYHDKAVMDKLSSQIFLVYYILCPCCYKMFYLFENSKKFVGIYDNSSYTTKCFKHVSKGEKRDYS